MLYIKNIQDFLSKNNIKKLDLENAKKIYEKIIKDLNKHNYLYYVKSSPIISDYEYDLLFKYLKDIEKKFPNIIKKDSPSQKLTSQIQESLKKVKHSYLLLSLENTYNIDEVAEKLNKLEKESNTKIKFYIEPKYDWLSIELIYKNWIFYKAITRWDWIIGEDVTENVKTIRTLPLSIPYKWDLHIRWEIIIKKSEFIKVNNERKKLWLEIYSNPRNLASWSLRQLNTEITRKRKLDFIAYEILNYNNIKKNVEFYNEMLDFLEQQWFWVYDFFSIINNTKNILTSNNFKNLSNIIELFKKRQWLNKENILNIIKSQELKSFLDLQDVEFDWLVIKINNLQNREKIWYTSHHPKRAFAFKYPAKQISSKILNIELSVWRSWIITPVFLIKQVELWWVNIKRVTWHNFNFIKEKDINIWDYVRIIRSWEVIPYVESTIRNDWKKISIDNSNEQKNIIKKLKNYFEKNYDFSWLENNNILYLNYILNYKIYEQESLVYKIESIKSEDNEYLVKIVEPNFCPICGWNTFHPEWEVALKCINVSCPAQVKEKIVHFCSKNWLNIEWLSEKTIELFLKINIISDYWDIFFIPEKKENLVSLPWFDQKKIENIIFAINNKKIIELDKFLSSLWIEFVWPKTSKIISQNIKFYSEKFFINKNEINFFNFIEFILSDKWKDFLLSINWIWTKVIYSIQKFFAEKHNIKIIKKLLKKVKIVFSINQTWKFLWQIISITWSINEISRNEITNFIEKNWWEFSDQITKNTTILLIWKNPWKNKISKAKKYNIKTYSLEKFLKENWFITKQKPRQETLF